MSHDINAIDLDGQEGELMTGVFRWKKSHKLRSLPTSPNFNTEKQRLDVSKGWMEYFTSRVETGGALGELVSFVQKDLAMIDCLSFPLSVLQALRTSGLSTASTEQRLSTLHIVCLGCSAKAEERVLRETCCFEELALGLQHHCSDIELYMVGPEMSCTQKDIAQGNSSARTSSYLCPMRAHTFKGTAGTFFKEHKSLLPLPDSRVTDSATTVNTVCVGFNCGFGNYENPGLTRYDLLMSWYSDLVFLLSFPLMPLIFTCANDYADLDGECYLHSHFLGSNFICLPQKNAFSCASTFVSDAVAASQNNSPSDFSCGNSYWYAVQGTNAPRRRKFSRLDGSSASFKLPVGLDTSQRDRYAFMANLLDSRNRKVTIPIEQCIISQKHKWRICNVTAVSALDVNAMKAKISSSDSSSNDLTSPSLESMENDDNFIEMLANASLMENSDTDLGIVTSTVPTIRPPAVPPLEPKSQLEPELVVNEVVAQDVSLTQVVDSSAGTLIVTYDVPTGVPISCISAHIGNDGKMLILTINTQDINVNDKKPLYLSKHEVNLVQTVQAASVTAKVSKKKRTLTLTAKLTG